MPSITMSLSHSPAQSALCPARISSADTPVMPEGDTSRMKADAAATSYLPPAVFADVLSTSSAFPSIQYDFRSLSAMQYSCGTCILLLNSTAASSRAEPPVGYRHPRIISSYIIIRMQNPSAVSCNMAVSALCSLLDHGNIADNGKK